MTKKRQAKNDINSVMVQIQEQLAVLDSKLDSFMTKSLTELAQALAASKPAPRPVVQPSPNTQTHQHHQSPQRQMYAVVCFECGKDTELPFKPSGNRPVYCKECFALRRNRPAPVVPSLPGAPASIGASAPQKPDASAGPSSTAKAKKAKPASKAVKAQKKGAKKSVAKKKKK